MHETALRLISLATTRKWQVIVICAMLLFYFAPSWRCFWSSVLLAMQPC